MKPDNIEKVAGVGACGLWIALHGWLGWLLALYGICVMLDCITGNILALKEKKWNSSKARQGLWHKGGCIIMICVSALTDILLGLAIDHISGLNLSTNFEMLITPIVLFWFTVSELGSIVENAASMGAPIPPVLKSVFEKISSASGTTIDKNTKNQ